MEPEAPPEPLGEAAVETNPTTAHEDLGAVGCVVLVVAALGGCCAAAGCIAMIWLGVDCLAGGEEGGGTGGGGSARGSAGGSAALDPVSCGPSGVWMLALGWLPCACCFCHCVVRRVRRKRVRVAPLAVPGSIGLVVCYEKGGAVAGPLPLFEAATRVLRRGIAGENPIWVVPDGADGAAEPPDGALPLSSYLNMNAVWVHCQRDYDDHRRIEGSEAGWGGPRQQVFEDLRRTLFGGVRVTTPVAVNIYDWSGKKAIVAMNKWACCGCRGGGVMGAFHAGVEVLGREYSFGWNDEGTTGVFWVEPKGAGALFGHRFRERVVLGEVSTTAEELEELVAQLEKEWMGYMYDMWHKNCNHFCDALVDRLSSKSTGDAIARIPPWVNRLLGSGAVFWDKVRMPPERCMLGSSATSLTRTGLT